MESCTSRSQSPSEAGFSLVELSIVMVIIGLLITAITVGKDTMRTAEMNTLYTKGVGPWIQSIYAFHAKTGKIPACGHQDQMDCPTLFKQAGLGNPGDQSQTLRVDYWAEKDATSSALTLSRIEALGEKGSRPRARVYLTDPLSEGLFAVQGYVNGVMTDPNHPVMMQFDMTQFATFQSNL